jgi:hypothetical protein
VKNSLDSCGSLGQWAGPPHKEAMNMKPNVPGAGGWDEPSPPAQRRNLPPNYDDGTSLWGNKPPPPPPGLYAKQARCKGSSLSPSVICQAC